MKKGNTEYEIIRVRLDKNIPAQRMALEKLTEYRQKTGLSKKDALTFLIIGIPGFLPPEIIQILEEIQVPDVKATDQSASIEQTKEHEEQQIKRNEDKKISDTGDFLEQDFDL